MKLRLFALSATAALLSIFALPAAATTTPSSTESDPALTQRVDANENIASAGERVERSAGHIDLGPKLIDNQWTLMARDDTETTPVWRHVADMIYRVSDEGILEVPQDQTYSFINDADHKVWVVPQQEIAQVVWLGWNTQDPGVTDNVNGTVTLSYGGHEGPGQFTVFVQAGNFGAPQVLWTSDKNEQQPIDVELHSHTHANWVFTEPGIHHVHLTASATLNDGTTVSDTQTLTFAVGTDTDATNAYESAERAHKSTPEQTSESGVSERTESAAHNAEADSSSSILPLVVGLGAGVVVIALIAFVLLKRREATTKKEARGEM
ncbi:choice-of-anchor M domain-containing protein [Arcanobacterium pinnipediorum]|uniref:Choice-of-anchor M domain-containing protein n=1 Tax=Arcanobacterium pinnipediorum TaxID=1503041 RepID=A0ABY5AJ91_9ACTO|nr:choice-of-anchor M domain-containing protein [Arcanobacterium pinnipediorum]USR79826.1 choice-of-anchor M domain-containing protein [Arcanobacterium pinnipediorum]